MALILCRRRRSAASPSATGFIIHRDRPCEPCHVQEVFATGQPQKAERISPITGQSWEIHAFPILDESGRVVLVAEHLRDITERHLAEKALKESEERFRAIFETAQDSIFIKDRSLRYIQVNPAMERLFGCLAADIIGKTGAELFGEAGGAHVRAVDQRVLNGEVVKAAHTKPVLGVPTTFHVVKVPLHDEAGEVAGLCGIARDITDLKQAEEALRESEARFKFLFEYAPDAYYLMDVQGNFIAYNRGAEELSGYRREEIIGKNYQTLPLFDDRENSLIATLLQQAVHGEILGPVELFLNRKGGQQVIIEAKALPLQSQGETLLLGVARDITARKQAEEALKESEERFRHISSTISDISYSCTMSPDGSYAIDWMAGAAEAVSGYTAEEIKAQRCWSFLVIEEDRPLFEKHIISLAVGSSGMCELRLRHKNGGIVWVAAFAEIFKEQGQPELLRIYGGLVDITARKQAEEALRLSESRFRAIFEIAPVGISMSDLRGRIMWTNRALQQILGYTAEELRGMPFQEVTHPEDLGENLRLQEELLAGKCQHYSLEKRYLQKDGGIAWAEVMVALLRDARREPQYLLATVIDRTARKQAEAELRECEQRFRDITENAAEWVWEVDAQGKYTLFQPGGGAIVGI